MERLLIDFHLQVLKRQIASKSTIAQAQELLELVVENGTAYKLKTDRYKFAGKTGTAQINYRRGSRGTRVGGYQASFIGYFPAKAPIYSCIVVIRKPKQHGIYGGEVAGPVFREIADKCYNAKIDLHQALNINPKPVLADNKLPSRDIGAQKDMKTILSHLGLPHYGDAGTPMAVLKSPIRFFAF